MPTGNSRSLAALTALALAAGGAVALAGSASAAPGGALVYGLTGDGRIVTFRAQTPSAASNGVTVSGLNVGENLVGIDVRPATGDLLGVTNGPLQDRIVRIDPATGAATQVDVLDVQLDGTSFGVDVNPVADALRIVSTSRQNLRHPFATGTTVRDTDLSYASGPAPVITAAAYTNNTAGATSTTLYDLDSDTNSLVKQDPANSGALTVVGALGVDFLTNNGFDVDPAGPTAYASLQTPTGYSFWTVDLTTGRAVSQGPLINNLVDIAVATPRFQVVDATVVEGADATVTVRRTGDLTDAATVDATTESGTATEGSDFARTTATLSFAANEATKTFTVPTRTTGGVEGAETFTVRLSNPSGGTVLSPATGTVTITDGGNPRAYALTTGNAIRTISLNDPAASPSNVPVLGLAPSEDLVGIDVRPATGELYGVTSSNRVVVINPSTGQATASGNAISPALSGTAFGVDFNPTVDRLRIVSNNGQNLRVNPVTGDTVNDTTLAFKAGDANAGKTPAVLAAAYTDNVKDATATTLYDIDATTDALVTQLPANDGVLSTVGPIGVALAATSTVGLDIAGDGGAAFAVLRAEGATNPFLARIDLSTGAARSLGDLRDANATIEDLTVVPTAPVASPSPSPTGTASPSPSSSPGLLRPLRLTVQDDTIVPTEAGVITATGTPGARIELLAYSRPSTDYGVVREATLGADGTTRFEIFPGTNTRLYARYAGTTDTDSPSVVQNVATALSLTVVRNGSLDYTFQGRILPRRAGQLITLYRVESDGREVITSQIKTDSTGTWRIRRQFTGQGTFGFLARTGQTLTNVSGASNEGQPRPTAIYAGPQR